MHPANKNMVEVAGTSHPARSSSSCIAFQGKIFVEREERKLHPKMLVPQCIGVAHIRDTIGA